MSRELQPPVLSVSLVKIELPTVIKNELPESEIGMDDILDSSESEEEIIPDVKDLDIVYHPLSEESIKCEILESKYCESVETQVSVKAENSPFIKTENITQRNKTADTSDENVTKGTGQAVVEIQASNEHSYALSDLEADEQSVLNFSKNLNGISVKSRKSKSPKKTDFVECYKTDETTLWEKGKEKIKVIEAPLIPVEAHEYISLANDRHVCKHCQHAYTRLDNLKSHIRIKHRKVTTMYQCPYCPYKSKWKYTVNNHIILNHQDTKDAQWFQKLQKNVAECYKTDETTLWEKGKEKIKVIKAPVIPVEAHEYISLANDRHVCKHCQHEYTRLGNLKSHIRIKHRKVTTMYQCPYCPYKSKWKYTVNNHIILNHQDTKDAQWFQSYVYRYHCDKCDYKTYTSTHLKNHKLSHLKPEEMRYFYCYHCSYKAKWKESLKKHIFCHHFKNFTQEKSYHCDKCDYKAVRSTYLKSHKLTHLKPKEVQYFYCYHCSYKSIWKASLKGHIFIHFKKEQVKFDCYICNFVTTKRKSIIKHIRKHSKVQNKSEINEGN